MGGYIGRGQPVAAETNSVESADIVDDAVTNAKIATNAVTGDSIAANAVGNSELSDNAVDTAELFTLTISPVSNTTLPSINDSAVPAGKGVSSPIKLITVELVVAVTVMFTVSAVTFATIPPITTEVVELGTV